MSGMMGNAHRCQVSSIPVVRLVLIFTLKKLRNKTIFFLSETQRFKNTFRTNDKISCFKKIYIFFIRFQRIFNNLYTFQNKLAIIKIAMKRSGKLFPNYSTCENSMFYNRRVNRYIWSATFS